MIYRLQITPDAITDIESAAEWYEREETGLGFELISIISDAIDSLSVNPLRHRLRERRRNVRLAVHKTLSLQNHISGQR